MTRHFTFASYSSYFYPMLDFTCEEDKRLSVTVKIHKDMFIFLCASIGKDKYNLTQEELEAIKNAVKELTKSFNIDISTLPWITSEEDAKEKCKELMKEAEARIIKAANDCYDLKDTFILCGYN